MAKILFGATRDDLRVAYGGYIDELQTFVGHEVLKTSNPDEIVEAMVSKEVDLVIVQGPMELGSFSMEETAGGWAIGYVALQKARERGSKTPAIFLQTVYVPPEMENMVVLDLLRVRMDYFLEIVREVLG